MYICISLWCLWWILTIDRLILTDTIHSVLWRQEYYSLYFSFLWDTKVVNIYICCSWNEKLYLKLHVCSCSDFCLFSKSSETDNSRNKCSSIDKLLTAGHSSFWLETWHLKRSPVVVGEATRHSFRLLWGSQSDDEGAACKHKNTKKSKSDEEKRKEEVFNPEDGLTVKILKKRDSHTYISFQFLPHWRTNRRGNVTERFSVLHHLLWAVPSDRSSIIQREAAARCRQSAGRPPAAPGRWWIFH